MNKVKVFDAYYKNKAGIWYFVPEDFSLFIKNEPVSGFGSIKYPEGSVYVGEIFFDGKDFKKQGIGQQDFTYSELGHLDENINEKIYKFIGKFDYKKNDWIYGNGVLYYRDKNGLPSHFVKGFFRDLSKMKEYEGEFDYSTLLDGYAKEMEFDYDSRKVVFCREYTKIENKRCKLLLLGDSYIEFWNYEQYAGENIFEHCFDLSKVRTLGVGGAINEDFVQYLNQVNPKFKTEKALINLGFNDLHSGEDIDSILHHLDEVIGLVKSKFDAKKIIICAVVHSPNFDNRYQDEEKLNHLIYEYSQRKGYEFLNLNEKIKNSRIHCFAEDKVHLNEHGYELFYKSIERGIYD